jgi:hypothetical protein
MVIAQHAAGRCGTRHDQLEIPIRRLLDGADNAVTGIVDELVDAAEPPNVGLDRVNCIERVGDIKLMREKPLR